MYLYSELGLVEMMAVGTFTLFGILIHLFVDWYLQDDWQAQNKMKFVKVKGLPLPHPAGVLHSLLHTAAVLLIFPLWAAALVGILHYLIDIRKPLAWWRKTFNQTTDPNNPVSLHVAIWQDQVAHFLVIGVVSYFVVH